MFRLFALLAAFAALILPATVRPEAADIAAAARGVVRVVIMGTDGERVFPVSHGTGFAVRPNRIVTNAHVIREVLQDDTLRIAIVPPDGDGADYGKVIAVSSAKDLAVIETTGALRLPALTVAGGVASDGDEVAAVGYPMNVDRAQGLDLSDLFRPQPPVKSRGFVSGTRPSRDFDSVLHTAPIARGNSGGPLLDGCGRVVGVNSFGTTSDDGSDAEFSFAVSNRELLPFLKSAGIEPAVNAMPCRSMAQLDAAERERLEAEQAAARAKLAQRAETDRERRERARLEAQLSVMDDRENAMALAGILLLLAAGSGFASWNLRAADDGGKKMRIAGALAAVAAVASLAVWFTRPGLDAIDRRVADAMAERPESGDQGVAPDSAGAADLSCSIQPDRSRIVGQPPKDLDFGWNPDGCVNGRTQYGFADGKWTRLFVPNDEDTISVNSFDPETRVFRTDRFPLSQSAMARAREARAQYKAPTCGAQNAASELGEMQSGVASMLPQQATERLVYSCQPKRD
ncbi:Serine protease Do-like HtrB [Tsuneonella dongtanensis]|uniref:Serine protease Do-like HtrB n=1 Tax=Tsuneonella dongtanensis TaxID=692370 RepID=A0A1B2ADT1_9SPHN|nr:serine protease [Tsuneonella dongtanensis]ANY20303.1 Serine protease Do-like HtrB [Tsuneonella dongtanensis]